MNRVMYRPFIEGCKRFPNGAVEFPNVQVMFTFLATYVNSDIDISTTPDEYSIADWEIGKGSIEFKPFESVECSRYVLFTRNGSSRIAGVCTMITADVSNGMSGIEYQVIPNGNYALTISSRRFINLEDSKNYGTCINWRLVIGSYPPIFDMDCEDYETVTHVSIFQEYDRSETIMIRRPCVSTDDILMIKFDELYNRREDMI